MSGKRTVVERFWNKVRKEPNGCWIWTGGKNQYGYGLFHTGIHMGTQETSAHRIAYALKHGLIPKDKCVLHICNNRDCVNPAHLRKGTRIDAGRYRKMKGRAIAPRGEDSHSAKLTWNIVYEIRAKYARDKEAGKVGYGTLAEWVWKQHHKRVRRHTIRSIVLGLSWKDDGATEYQRYPV